MQKIIRYVATNDRGLPIGKFHHNCKHADELVDRIRELHEDEEKPMGYRRIAKLLGISRHTVRDICRYSRRAQTYKNWTKREVVVGGGAHAAEAVVED